MVASSIVGREGELGRLRAALDPSDEGGPSLLLIAGEAGVGKSRLIEEFGREARERGARVLIGGCPPLGPAGVPFAPVVEALRSLARDGPAEALEAAAAADALRDLARLVPDLDRLTPEVDRDRGRSAVPAARGGDPAPESSSASTELRVFEPLLTVLEHLADDAPVALVLEDLHWAGQSTRDLLAFLSRTADADGLLVVGSYRTDAVDRRHPLRLLLAEFRRDPAVEHLDLRPLTAVDVARHVEELLGEPPPWELLDDVVRRGEGNPFFTEQLVAAYRRGDPAGLTETLRDTLLADIERLPDDVQGMLRVVAAAGRRVDVGTLSTATGIDRDDLAELLRGAVDRRVLVPSSERGSYAFRHALLREAVYSTLLPGERAPLHRRLAETLADPSADRTTERPTDRDVPTATELAYHWHAAGDDTRALAATVEAAREAERQYAFAEAGHHLDLAMELWDAAAEVGPGGDSPTPTSESGPLTAAELHRWAAEVAYLAGQFDKAGRLVSQAIDRAAADSTAEEQATLHERLGRYLWVAGRGDAAIAAYARAVELTPAEPPSSARAGMLAALAQGLMLEHRSDEAGRRCEEAIAVARHVGDRRHEGHALNTQGVVVGRLGRFDDALEALTAARTIADELGLPEDRLRAHMNLSSVLLTAGDADAAAEAALEGLAIARERGLHRSWGAALVSNAIEARLAAGRWREARELAGSVAAPPAGSLSAGWLHLHLAALACADGREAAASRHLALARSFGVATDAHTVVVFRIATAEIAWWAGRHDEALTAVAGAADRVPTGPVDHAVPTLYALALRVHADRAHDARQRGDRPAFEAARRDGLAVGERVRAVRAGGFGAPPTTDVITAWLNQADAEAGRLDDASQAGAWLHAAERWTAAGVPDRVAYARWRFAAARLVAGGRPRDAVRALRDAYDTATELGHVPLLERVRTTARSAGVALPSRDQAGRAEVRAGRAPRPQRGTARGDSGELTPRQLEVLRLVASGRTNQQIADELVISPHTVSRHLENIYARLHVSSRAAATTYAHTHGLLTSPPVG